MKIPIYYGYNLTWCCAATDDWVIGLIAVVDNKYPVNYVGGDMRWNKNIYFTSGHIVVFPGYTAKFYYRENDNLNLKGTEYSSTFLSTKIVYKTGDTNFSNPTKPIYIIWVGFDDDKIQDDTITWKGTDTTIIKAIQDRKIVT